MVNGRSGSSRSTQRATVLAAALCVAATSRALDADRAGTGPGPVRTVRIPAGSYRPLYTEPAPNAATPGPRRSVRRPVAAFEMDTHPVTNAQFLEFVRQRPEWRRSRASRLFADAAYLRHWRGDLDLGPEAPADSPVVFVSWFAARAYLKTHGKTLPTVDQWEYVAAASETRRDASRERPFLDRLRAWYAAPAPARLPAVGSTFTNVYGVGDMHGLIWEWTLDFNSALVTGESRADGSRERTLYCGSGAVTASDFEDYAAFMRYAFRGSLEARYAVATLGFRGVRTFPRAGT